MHCDTTGSIPRLGSPNGSTGRSQWLVSVEGASFRSLKNKKYKLTDPNGVKPVGCSEATSPLKQTSAPLHSTVTLGGALRQHHKMVGWPWSSGIAPLPERFAL